MKRLCFLVPLFTLVLPAFAAQAQIVNVQEMLFKEDNGFSLSLGLTGDWRIGNTEYTLFKGSTVLRYGYDAHVLLLSVNGAYGIKGDDRFERRIFEHLRYRYQALDWLGVEGYLQHGYNEFVRLPLRVVGGIGPRFTPYRNDWMQLHLGTAYMIEFTEYSNDSAYSDAGKKHYYHRWSSYLAMKLKATDYLSFVHTTYAQPSLEDMTNIKVMVDTTMVVKVTDMFKVTISHDLSYHSHPPEGIKDLDSALVVGINMSLGPWGAKKD